MSQIEAHGLGVNVPPGWEGRVYRRAEAGQLQSPEVAGAPAPSGELTFPVVHLASVPIPNDAADYGSDVVETLGPDDAFIVLKEFEPADVVQPLFAREGMPRVLVAEDFDPSALQRRLARQAGRQIFFHEAGRAFCLYVVLGGYRRRNHVVGAVNLALAGIRIDPGPPGVNEVIGPFTIAAALLALGGAFKAVSPNDTANALRGVGLPGSPGIVRVGGVLEAAIGVFAIASGGRVGAALVAASYLGFAAFVALALRREAPIATCGCFGKADTPPSLVHVVFDLIAAATAIALVVDPAGGLADTLAHQPLLGIPYLLLVATGVYLSFLALTLLPRTLALVREARST